MKIVQRLTPGPPYKGKNLAVISDRECWTNFHGTLRRRRFSVGLRLFGKVDGGLVPVHFEEIRRFSEAGATQRAGGIDIPTSWNI